MTASLEDHHRADALRVIRRRAWIVVVLAVIGAAAAYLAASGEQKQYTATASLLFQQQNLGQQLFGYSVATQVNDPGVAEATAVQLASAPIVATATASTLGMPLAEVIGDIAVTPAGSSQVVNIAATTDSPRTAAVLANAYARSVVTTRRGAQQQLVQQATGQVRAQLDRLLATSPHSRQVPQLQSRLSQLGVLAALQTGDVQISDPATAPRDPSGPHVKRDAGLGLLLGLIVGLALALLLERVDRRVRDEDDLASLYGLTVLAHIPHSRTLERSAPATASAADPGVSESFRILRARLRYFNVDRKLQTLLITSAVPQEGKSTVAWHLGWAAAATAPDEPVLLIEADLRRPSISGSSGLKPAPGLSDALTQLEDWREAIQIVDTGPGHAGVLQVMTAGGTPPNPTELIESDRFRSVLAEARNEYSLIVIDAPPAQLVSDALALMGQVDGVVVVGRLNQTQRDAASGLRTTLTAMHAPVLGVVINGVSSVGGRYGYGYGAYEASADDGARRPSGSLTSQ